MRKPPLHELPPDRIPPPPPRARDSQYHESVPAPSDSAPRKPPASPLFQEVPPGHLRKAAPLRHPLTFNLAPVAAVNPATTEDKKPKNIELAKETLRTLSIENAELTKKVLEHEDPAIVAQALQVLVHSDCYSVSDLPKEAEHDDYFDLILRICTSPPRTTPSIKIKIAELIVTFSRYTKNTDLLKIILTFLNAKKNTNLYEAAKTILAFTRALSGMEESSIKCVTQFLKTSELLNEDFKLIHYFSISKIPFTEKNLSFLRIQFKNQKGESGKLATFISQLADTGILTAPAFLKLVEQASAFKEIEKDGTISTGTALYSLFFVITEIGNIAAQCSENTHRFVKQALLTLFDFSKQEIELVSHIFINLGLHTLSLQPPPREVIEVLYYVLTKKNLVALDQTITRLLHGSPSGGIASPTAILQTLCAQGALQKIGNGLETPIPHRPPSLSQQSRAPQTTVSLPEQAINTDHIVINIYRTAGLMDRDILSWTCAHRKSIAVAKAIVALYKAEFLYRPGTTEPNIAYIELVLYGCIPGLEQTHLLLIQTIETLGNQGRLNKTLLNFLVQYYKQRNIIKLHQAVLAINSALSCPTKWDQFLEGITPPEKSTPPLKNDAGGVVTRGLFSSTGLETEKAQSSEKEEEADEAEEGEEEREEEEKGKRKGKRKGTDETHETQEAYITRLSVKRQRSSS